MTKLRDVEFDGVQQTSYIQDSNGSLIIKNTQDVEPVLKKYLLICLEQYL